MTVRGTSRDADHFEPRFRFTWLGLLAFGSAIGLVLMYPHYFLLVALLFFPVMSLLTFVGAMLGLLPAEKRPSRIAKDRLEAPERLSMIDDV